MDLSDFDYRENGWFSNVTIFQNIKNFNVIVPNGCENYLSVDVQKKTQHTIDLRTDNGTNFNIQTHLYVIHICVCLFVYLV